GGNPWAGAGLPPKAWPAWVLPTQRGPARLGDREPGKPIHNAIVWQDRRTADRCAALRRERQEAFVTEKTGLLLDPYFSATKIEWMLDHVEGARAAATSGRLAFGTVDTFLLWRLTGGRVPATAATHPARAPPLPLHTGACGGEPAALVRPPTRLLPPR